MDAHSRKLREQAFEHFRKHGVEGAAVTTTLSFQTNDVIEWTVIASADADTVTATITHNMGSGGPPLASIVPIVQATAALSLWAITTLTQTGWIATKATTAGSGGAGAQIRVRMERRR